MKITKGDRNRVLSTIYGAFADGEYLFVVAKNKKHAGGDCHAYLFGNHLDASSAIEENLDIIQDGMARGELEKNKIHLVSFPDDPI